jgi:hypothetical protein
MREMGGVDKVVSATGKSGFFSREGLLQFTCINIASTPFLWVLNIR